MPIPSLANCIIKNKWSLNSDSFREVKYYCCPACDSLIMWPSPPPFEMASHFASVRYCDILNEKAIIKSKKPRYKAVLQMLLGFGAKPGYLLDVGCAHGYGLDVAIQYGWEPAGIEIDDCLVEYVRRKGHLLFKGTSVLDCPGERLFDVILYLDVLNYFADPYTELLQAHQRLMPGGWLVSRMSLWGPLSSKLANISQLLGMHKKLHAHATHYLWDHLIIYSENGYDLVHKNAGFHVYAKVVDWGTGWRASNAISAQIIRNASHLFSKISGVRITPSMFYFAKKL